MKTWQLIALLLGLLLVVGPITKGMVRAEEDDYEDEGEADEAKAEKNDEEADVVVITKDNWDTTVKAAKYALVEFYAPWCGHCKRLAPEYAKAATTLKAYDPSIVIGKVDATEESDLASNYEVKGYPTIKWFVDGEVALDYTGGRDADGITKWIKKKTGPAAVNLADKAALEKLEETETVLVLGYFSKLEGAAYDAFIKVAQTTEDATFAETTDASVAAAAGLTKANSLAVITNHKSEDRSAVPLSVAITEESIKELITSEKLPPTIEFNDQNSQKIFGSGIEKQLILVAKSEDLESSAAVFKAFRAGALANKGKLVFVTVDLDGSAKDPVVNFFGLKEEEAPILVGFEMNKNKKYRFKEDFNEASVLAFAKAIIEGTATPDYKSAPIPEDDKDGEVQIVVGKSFNDIVLDAEKDVLLEVYAPWCGHCKSLEPIYKKLAKRFKKVESIVIAKMDGTENEHPEVDVKGFPTIIFFPAGKGAEPIPFEGERTLKGMTKFLKDSAKKPFELPKKKKSKDEDDEEDSTKDEL